MKSTFLAVNSIESLNVNFSCHIFALFGHTQDSHNEREFKRFPVETGPENVCILTNKKMFLL